MQLYERMLSSLWALLRNVLATTPTSVDDPDYFVVSEASDPASLEGDDELFVKSMRYGLGRLLPGELDVAAANFSTRPLQNLELCDALPARLSIATLPLLSLQVRVRAMRIACFGFATCASKPKHAPRSLHHSNRALSLITPVVPCSVS